MIASTIIASALASSTPLATPVAVPVAEVAQVTPAKPGTAEGKMDCCKDGCECCGKDKAAKTESKDEHAH